MQKRQQQETINRLAFAGALEQAYALVEIFPDLLVELTRIVKERAPKRRMSPEQRAELAHAVDAASSNGNAPKKRGPRGPYKKRHMSAAARKRMAARMRKQWREAKRAGRTSL